MDNRTPGPERFFRTACYFESSLVVVALLLGLISDVDPFSSLAFSETALTNGIVATLPLLMLFFAMRQMRYVPLQKIRTLLFETLGPLLYRRHWTDLLVLAGIAGFSEEILFRGVLQVWLEDAWGAAAGLIVSNLIFASVHAVTLTYALLAMLIGLYLGMALDYGGERNLLTPIVIHTLYDFGAFIVILRDYRNTL